MDFELQARTPPGHALVSLAEDLAADFATRAGRHDQEGTFARENVEALRQSGYLAAPIPVECGGMGVESVHDVLVASSRLARGDASTAIGVNMHLGNVIRQVFLRRRALIAGDHDRAARVLDMMERVASGAIVISAAITEAGRELTEPATTARRTNDGWIIDGTKIFGTMAPAATHLTVSAAIAGDDERYAFFQVPATAPGVRVNDDWDALGMRGSGSGSITFDDVHVPESAWRGDFPVGRWSPEIQERYLHSGLMHASGSLGIAEAAVALIRGQVAGRRKGRDSRPLAERPSIQMLAAENVIDLSAMRAVFGRAGVLIDWYYCEHQASIGAAAVQGVFTEVQSAKTFVHLAAIRIVDRAMAIAGGAGYMSRHPLSRLYRDVRAGPFMHPLGVSAAQEFIGRSVLGLDVAA